MKIHMVSKGGLSKLHVCPHRGEGGSKIPKNPSTWFMDVPLNDKSCFNFQTKLASPLFNRPKRNE